MHSLNAFAAASALISVNAGLALADGSPSRGHALGPDLVAFARPLAVAPPARGGHAFGADLAALRTPLDCTAPAVAGKCPAAEAALEPADLAPGE
jgi:hypothetical protein